MRFLPRTSILAFGFAALAMGALAFAACGGDDGDTKATVAPAKTPAASSPAAEATKAPATAEATKAATVAPTQPAAAIKVGTTAKGPALTDDKGLTFYTFDNDKEAGKSACSGGCAQNWPPAVTTAAAPPAVTGATGAFTIITRDDGAKQFAYKGKPLYRFASDAAAGDVKGDGVGGIWHIATP